MFEFQKPVIHAGLSSVQGSSSLTGGSSSLIGGAGSGPPNHQSSSTVSQPGITRQTIICDNPSPDIRHEQKSKARGIPSTLVLSESKFIASQNAAGNQMMQPASGVHQVAVSTANSAQFFSRTKQINPSNKVASKQNLMVSSSIECGGGPSSSLASSNNSITMAGNHNTAGGGHHEEDVSSSHVDTDKPNKMSINPSLTQSVAGVQRDAAKH